MRFSTMWYWGPAKAQTSQGSKIALVRSYLRVPQAAGQVKILIFLVKIKSFPIYANNFCDAGQVPIFRYFEACQHVHAHSLIRAFARGLNIL